MFACHRTVSGPRARVYVRLRLRRSRAPSRTRRLMRIGVGDLRLRCWFGITCMGVHHRPRSRARRAQARCGGAGRARSELELDRRRRTPDRAGGRAENRRPSAIRGLRGIAGPFQTLDWSEHSQPGDRRCQNESSICARSTLARYREPRPARAGEKLTPSEVASIARTAGESRRS